MKLLSIVIEGVLGAPDGQYSFEVSDGVPCALGLVTGGSATGKTSLLEAIVAAKEVVGAYGQPPRPLQVIRRGATSASLVARWALSAREHAAVTAAEVQNAVAAEPVSPGQTHGALVSNEPLVVTTRAVADEHVWRVDAEPVALSLLEKLFGRYSMGREEGKVEYFPARRHIHPELWRTHPGDLEQLREASLRVSKDPSKYGFIRSWLFELVVAEGMRMQEILATAGMLVPTEDLDLLAPFKYALASLSETLRFKHVEAGRSGATTVWFVRRDGRQVELADLSESETQAVLFAATFVRHGLDHSLVLIDTPELSIPPEKQRQFLQAIAALGSDDQVIVATSSAGNFAELEAHRISLDPGR